MAEGLGVMFGTGNPFLSDMAQQQWNINQQKAQQDLQTSLQEAQRKQELHPYEIAGKQASTALNNAYAKETEQRIQKQMKENFFKLKEDERKAVIDDMNLRHQRANAVMGNNGIVPLDWQQSMSPEELSYFSPENLPKTLKITKDFIESNPTWMIEDKKEKARFERERALQELRNKGMIGAATVRASAAGNKAAGPGKMSLEQYLTSLNQKIATMPEGPEKEAVKAEADRTELQMYRKQAEIAKARAAGTVDPGATSEAGKVVTKPEYVPTPTPREGGAKLPPNVTKSGW